MSEEFKCPFCDGKEYREVPCGVVGQRSTMLVGCEQCGLVYLNAALPTTYAEIKHEKAKLPAIPKSNPVTEDHFASQYAAKSRQATSSKKSETPELTGDEVEGYYYERDNNP